MSSTLITAVAGVGGRETFPAAPILLLFGVDRVIRISTEKLGFTEPILWRGFTGAFFGKSDLTSGKALACRDRERPDNFFRSVVDDRYLRPAHARRHRASF